MSRPTPDLSTSAVMRKLNTTGMRLRCPNCEQGRVSHGLFDIQKVCSVCGVRFERQDGESLGAMVVVMIVIPPLSLVGFFITEALTDLSIPVNAVIWGGLVLAACLLLYRHARAAWIGISYLTGGVYADEE